MSHVVAAAARTGPHLHTQAEVVAAIVPLLTSDPTRAATARRLAAAAGVGTRGLALPLAGYRDLTGFGAASAAFLEVGTELGEHVVAEALAQAGVAPDEVDVLVFTTVTGVSAPSLDVLVGQRLGMRRDIRRVPSFGLGCAGGAGGLGIAHEMLAGRPRGVAVLLSVELCSLTLQREDTTANLVAAALFGDGAAAVVLVGAEHPDAAVGPRVVAAGSGLYAGTEDQLGWTVRDSGFGIVLAPGLPGLIRAHLADDVAAFLEPHDLKPRDVATWTVHAGGPRILDAVQVALDLEPEALAASHASLGRAGNLSSASVLDVLAAHLAEPHQPGSAGVVMAFGPGIGVELVLMRWP